MKQLTDEKPFRKGETLIVRPHDQRDCEALARAGQPCTFIRYSAGLFGTPWAIVEFEPHGKPLYLRLEDVVRQQREVQV